MKKIIIKIIYKLINLIENYEYRNLSLDQNDINKKILNTISNLDIRVESDNGFVKATDIHLTQPYKVYKIVLENNLFLECADNHILFTNNLEEVFCKDLKKGDLLFTKYGNKKVINIVKYNSSVSMFDFTIDDPNHRFYTNGILSHNTINAAITMLHFVTFNNDKNIMIVANIASTTIEIVDKIKSIYVHLPFFLKVGIKNWNQRTMIFENGCRIKTAARSRTPAIGFTIDFLYLDEFAHIPSNIIEPYYQAVYPVVSAVENSKIIITSTPNGMNLFYRLLTDAERPEGDPQKNQFKALRIYWYQVPGRFLTFYRLNPVKLFKFGLTEESLYEQVIANFSHLTKVEKKFDAEIEKETIAIHNNELCPEELTKSFQFYDNNNVLTPIQLACDVSTWKEDSIKNIGGEDAFNQEYGLRFINATRSILSESVIDTLIKGKKHFEYRDIPMFDDKLRFSYRDLTWVDEDTFNHANRKNTKGIMSIDISEGLGQDYTIINIFRIALKPIELIEAQKSNLYDFSDFFWLEQIGLYRSNLISVKQLADLFYMLAFEYFDYEKFRVVLETNTYGSEFLAHLPHVFDGSNNYGSGIFFRYKHRMDSSEEKVGLKLGDNKNLLVKDYQENMNKRNFNITNEDNIKEITTFVRHITSAGNVRYAADIGHDDCLKEDSIIMTNKGYKYIKDIEIGDLVLTHLGNYKKVINKCIKNFKGDMYKLKFKGQLELDITYNHPIYASNINYSRKICKKGNYNNYTNREWVLPENFKAKRRCVSIIENLEDNKNVILKWEDFFELNKYSYVDNIKQKEIILDSNFAKFLGLFLADGNVYIKDDFYRITIAFNSSQIELINEIKNYLENLGINTQEFNNKKKKSTNLSFNSKFYAEVLNFCYCEKEKIIPYYAYTLGKDLKYVLEYWLKGDGWIRKGKNNRKDKKIGCSISKKLALGMRDIAMSLGYWALINKYKRKRYNKDTKDQYWVTIYENRPKSSSLLKFNNYEYGSLIEKSEKYQYEGLTYNLEVEDDNSYTADGIVVHNCAMSLVNASSIFSRYDYKEMIQDFSKELPTDVLNYINNIINNSSEAKEVSDYSALINVNRRRKNATSYTYERSIDWHGKKYY